MKQTNGKAETIHARMRFWSYAVVTVIALTATACQPKNDAPAAVAVVPAIVSTSCGTCATLSGLVASAMSKSIDGYGADQGEMSLSFYGDAASVTAARAAGRMYQGQVSVTGVMRIRIAHTGTCNVPVGDYVIDTLTPGQWYSEQFANIQLRAAGPVALTLTLSRGHISTITPARIDLAGATFPFRLYTQVYVTPTAGGYCNLYGPEFYFEQ